jgi:hypothetical protein
VPIFVWALLIMAVTEFLFGLTYVFLANIVPRRAGGCESWERATILPLSMAIPIENTPEGFTTRQFFRVIPMVRRNLLLSRASRYKIVSRFGSGSF